MFQVLVSGAWENTATFTSAELAAGQIRFMHDGGEVAPTFSIQADDGETLNHRSNVFAGTVNFTNVNDAPVVRLHRSLWRRAAPWCSVRRRHYPHRHCPGLLRFPDPA